MLKYYLDLVLINESATVIGHSKLYIRRIIL